MKSYARVLSVTAASDCSLLRVSELKAAMSSQWSGGGSSDSRFQSESRYTWYPLKP